MAEGKAVKGQRLRKLKERFLAFAIFSESFFRWHPLAAQATIFRCSSPPPTVHSLHLLAAFAAQQQQRLFIPLRSVFSHFANEKKRISFHAIRLGAFTSSKRRTVIARRRFKTKTKGKMSKEKKKRNCNEISDGKNTDMGGKSFVFGFRNNSSSSHSLKL
ncbi:hypothetical protein ACFE04_011428 [Oxalis oulophora]